MCHNIYLEHRIEQEEDGLEVFHFLRNHWKLTTKKIRSVKYEEQGILLDGVRVHVRWKVKQGQLLKVKLNDSEEKEDRVLPNPMPLTILYEDQNLLFLDKEAGMVSHPARGHLTDSIANGAKAHFLEQQDPGHVHLIGRLDKDTSGVIGIAKNSVTAERMMENRKIGLLEKEYIAFVEGIMEEKTGYIAIPMEEHYDEEDSDRLKMRRVTVKDDIALDDIDPAKRAGTNYEVVWECKDFSVLRIHIETGRTHQIRFHMSEIGHALLGDPIYGHGDWGRLKRTALHAHSLTFAHPFTGEKMTLVSELPEDMAELLEGYDFTYKV